LRLKILKKLRTASLNSNLLLKENCVDQNVVARLLELISTNAAKLSAFYKTILQHWLEFERTLNLKEGFESIGMNVALGTNSGCQFVYISYVCIFVFPNCRLFFILAL